MEPVPEVWEAANDPVRRATEKGLTIPAADILIAACAHHHGVEVESTDPHFAELEKLRA